MEAKVKKRTLKVRRLALFALVVLIIALAIIVVVAWLCPAVSVDHPGGLLRATPTGYLGQ